MAACTTHARSLGASARVMCPRARNPKPCTAIILLIGLMVSSVASASQCFDYDRLRNGLAVHIPFDGDFRDASGNGVHGSQGNPPSFVAGKVGSAAASFDQLQRQFVSLGRPASLNFDTDVDFTVTFWVRAAKVPLNIDRNSYDDPAIIGNQNWDSSRNRGFIVAGSAPSSFIFAVGDGVRRTKLTQAVYFAQNEWSHFLISCNRSSNAVVYANGKLLAVVDIYNMAGVFVHNFTSGYDTVIGSDGPAGVIYPTWWDGEIDDVAIWRRALSSSDAAAVYARALKGLDIHSGLPMDCADTIAACDDDNGVSPLSFRVSCPGGCVPYSNANESVSSIFPRSASVCGAAVASGLASVSAQGPRATVTVRVDSNGVGYMLESVCGDGIQMGAEECDDGNADDHDGCSRCTVDSGYVCGNAADSSDRSCSTVCGDGAVTGMEICDDGGESDTCTSDCTVKPGHFCTSQLTARSAPTMLCRALACGDGVRSIGEECDDGNVLDGDGCSSSCQVEENWACKSLHGSAGERCNPPLWVASGGDDSGNCSARTPCATIHRASTVAAAMPGIAYIMVGEGVYNCTNPIAPVLQPEGSLMLRAVSGNVVLTCNGFGMAVKVTGGNLVMEGITVQNCAPTGTQQAAVVVLNGNATLTRCTFVHNSISQTSKTPRARAAGVFVQNDRAVMYSAAVFESCVFVNNSVSFRNTAWAIFQVTEAVQDSSVAGAAVAVNGTQSVSFTRCTFSGNGAYSSLAAGAVYISYYRNAFVRAAHCIFEDNAADGERESSGALFVSSAHPIQYIDRPEVSLENCTFRSNRAIIRSHQNARFPRAVVAGGVGISYMAPVCTRAKHVVSNCTFDDNSVSMASYTYSLASGAIGIHSSCAGKTSDFEIDVRASVFTRNQASAESVDMSAVSGSIGLFSYRGLFSHNTVSVSGNSFSDDFASIKDGLNCGAGGSAVIATVMTPNQFGLDQLRVIDNSYIFANNSHLSPAVDAAGKLGMAVAGAVCMFHYTTNGGPVYVNNSLSVTGASVLFAMTGLSASLQSVAASGIAAFYFGATVSNSHTISGSIFAHLNGSLATTGTNCLGAGAVALYFSSLDAWSSLNIERTVVTDSRFSIQAGSAAGAVGVMCDAAARGLRLSVVGCTADSNECPSGSGVIAIVAPTGSDISSNLVGSTFTKNKGGKGAGVIRMNVLQGSSTIANCSFDRNVGSDAGAVSLQVVENGHFSAMQSAFHRNVGSVAGGAISMEGVSGNVTDVKFIENEASIGGAMFVGRASGLWANRCLFQRNDASSGSDLYSGGSMSLVLIGCVVEAVRAVTTVAVLGSPDMLLRQNSSVTCPRGHRFQKVQTRNGLQLLCSKCQQGSYLIANGTDAMDVECAECPTGAVCAGGDDIRPIAGHWGTPGVTKKSYMTCPLGLCCATVGECMAGPCMGGHVGIMCSECPSGMSTTLMKRECVDNARCEDGKWFLPLIALVMVALFALFLMLPVGRSGMLRIVMGLVYPAYIAIRLQGNDSAESVAVLNGLVTLQFAVAPDLLTDVCLFPGFTPLSGIFIQLYAPLVLVGVAAVYVLYWHFGRALVDALRGRARETATPFPYDALYAVGWVAFPPIWATVLRLVTCTSIDGEERLYEMASVVCYNHGWQIFAFISFPLFVLVAPGALYVAIRLRPRIATIDANPAKGGNGDSAVVNGKAVVYKTGEGEKQIVTGRGPIALGLVGVVASSPYRAEYVFWDLVALSFQIVFSLCGVLIVDAGIKAFVLCFLVWFAFMFTWHMCPYRFNGDACFEVAAQFALLVIVTLQIRGATVLSLGLSDTFLSKGVLRDLGTFFVALQCICLVTSVLAISFAILRFVMSGAKLSPLMEKLMSWSQRPAEGWAHTPVPRPKKSLYELEKLRRPKRLKSVKSKERVEQANEKSKAFFGDVVLSTADSGSLQESQTTGIDSEIEVGFAPDEANSHGDVGAVSSAASDDSPTEGSADWAVHRPAQRRVSFCPDGGGGLASEDNQNGSYLSMTRTEDMPNGRAKLPLTRNFSAPGGSRPVRSSLRTGGRQRLAGTMSDTAALMAMRARAASRRSAGGDNVDPAAGNFVRSPSYSSALSLADAASQRDITAVTGSKPGSVDLFAVRSQVSLADIHFVRGVDGPLESTI